MKHLKNTLYFIAIFLTLQTTAQNFSGTITNTDSEAIENAQVVLQYPNAVYENDTVYSDALGFYTVGTTVDIEDLPNSNSSISYQINNNTLYISIYKDAINYVSSTGKLYSITGKLIAQCQLIKTTEHKYIGKFQLNNLRNTICIFTDGFFSVKIPLMKEASVSTGSTYRHSWNNRRLSSYSKAELATYNGIRLRQAQASEYSEAELVEAGLATHNGIRLRQGNSQEVISTDFDKLNLRNVRRLSLSKPDSHKPKADSQKPKANSLIPSKFGFDKGLLSRVEMLSLQKYYSGNKSKDANYHLIINPPNYLPIDSTLQNINPTQNYSYNFELIEEPGEAYLWRQVIDELAQNGTTFDIILKNNQFNFNDTLFNVGDVSWWKDTIPVNQSGPTNYDMTIIPHTTEGKIPLYALEKILTFQNGQQLIGQDTLLALEQEQKYVVNVFEFENEGVRKEANVEIRDNQNNVVFSGATIDGVVETNYIPTGAEGDGFEGVMTITPTDGNYFGTRMVVTSGDMTIQNKQDILNNLGVGYHGYEYTLPEIQTNFDKTDTISFYLVKQEREDPLHPGETLTMDALEIREMEGNSINTEYARYGEENIFFRETKPAEYDAYREHARNIFGFDFVENVVGTERSSSPINNYSIENDDYKDILGWNVSFGVNGTNTVSTNPSLFGKITINSRGEVGYDVTDWAGCAREDARKMEIHEVSSRVSYMNSSTPPSFPDTLNQKDRVYTNLFLHYRPTQVKQNSSMRNITNLGYLFVGVKNVGIKP